MSQNPTDDKSTLVQVMAWCCQATSHYLSQWWPNSVMSYVIRPQWMYAWPFRGNNLQILIAHMEKSVYVVQIWDFETGIHL